MIEAFDQPWKRRLEGTVGGYWGLFDGATRQAKFDWGKPVSNHPFWRGRPAAGMAFAALIFRRGVGAPLRNGLDGSTRRAVACGCG